VTTAPLSQAQSRQQPATPPPRVGISSWLWEQSKRPDRTREGFDDAVRAAVLSAAEYDWRTIDAMCEHLAFQLGQTLRAKTARVEFIAVHRATKRPRLRFECHGWTHDEDVAVQMAADAEPARQTTTSTTRRRN
jgi:hypothetical protein